MPCMLTSIILVSFMKSHSTTKYHFEHFDINKKLFNWWLAKFKLFLTFLFLHRLFVFFKPLVLPWACYWCWQFFFFLRALNSVVATLQHCSSEHQLDLVDAIRRYSKYNQFTASVKKGFLEMMPLTFCFRLLFLLLTFFKIWMTMDT